MKPTLVLKLIAAAGCTFVGARLWSAESHASGSDESVRSEARGDRSRPERPAPADVDSSATSSDLDGAASKGASADLLERSQGATSDGLATELPGRTPDRHPAPSESRPQSGSVAPIPAVVASGPPRIPEALARVAMRYVGRDPAAEEIWIEAIDQLELPEEARVDLIEDLNEEGFADPEKVTAADIPLILERLRIIERLAPLAIDEVNAASFEEAYKDLVNMLVRLRGTGSGSR